MHISVVPEMFALIFKSAFTPKMDDELAFLLAEAHHNLGQLEGLIQYARWRSRTAWTSRPSAVCSTTTRRASRWIHTPTLPWTRSSKRRKRWAISYPVLSDGFRYPLSLGSASAHPIEMWRSNKLGIKEKVSRGKFPRLTFFIPCTVRSAP